MKTNTKKFIQDLTVLLENHGVKKLVMSSDPEGNSFHLFGGVEKLDTGCLILWPMHESVDPYE